MSAHHTTPTPTNRGTTLSRWGSRVGLLVDLQQQQPPQPQQQTQSPPGAGAAGGGGGGGPSILLLNSHLSYPHNRYDVNNQKRQVDSLTRMLASYVKGREQLEGRPQRMLQVGCGGVAWSVGGACMWVSG